MYYSENCFFCLFLIFHFHKKKATKIFLLVPHGTELCFAIKIKQVAFVFLPWERFVVNLQVRESGLAVAVLVRHVNSNVDNTQNTNKCNTTSSGFFHQLHILLGLSGVMPTHVADLPHGCGHPACHVSCDLTELQSERCD